MCERWFGCRNRATAESLICSISSSSTLSSSFIQRFLLCLLLVVISVSMFLLIFFFLMLFPLNTNCENGQKKNLVKPLFPVWHFQFQQMSKQIQERKAVHLLSKLFFFGECKDYATVLRLVVSSSVWQRGLPFFPRWRGGKKGLMDATLQLS